MANTPTVTLANRLTAARLRAEMRPIDLARATGLSPAAISKLESGKRANCNTDTLARLAQALGVTTDQLVGLKPLPVAKSRRRARQAA